MRTETVERASAATALGARAAAESHADALLAVLRSNAEHGLTEDEARLRMAEHGPNRIRQGDGPGYLGIASRQLKDPLMVLLLAASLVSAAIGERVEGAVIAAIVVLNAALGFFQEAGAERAIVALRESVAQVAAVIRCDREREVPAEELVPGDVVVLREGDRVPADLRILRAERLEADESALTGESLPVSKSEQPVPPGTPLAERSSMLFAGTGVTRGRARALVTSTADATETGHVATLAGTAKPPPTPLQLRLGRLSRAMVGLGLGVTAILSLGMLARGEPLEEAFLVGVSVAVAAVPEGLAATVTIALAQGARAMAARGAIVRRLSAVETLGSASMIATDKTGTLTLNQLRVSTIEPLGGHSVEDVLETGVLASDADLVEDGRGWRVAGDPVDGAFLIALGATGSSDPRAVGSRRLVLELPFDPWRKRSTMVYEEGDSYRVAVKGAPETLIEQSRLSAADRDEALERALGLAAGGMRVLALAQRRVGRLPAEEELEADMELVGLVGLQDPLRTAAAPAIREARAAGIEVAMLTGDHPLTAASIGSALSLEPDAVFARVTPEDKLRLVESFQEAGHVVAVTGDGINDTPALRRADVGVAMGESGTEAAREAAEIVLTDDDFATIVAAIREGRRITDNVRKFVAFLLSANLGEVVLFGVAVLVGLGVPMTVVQVLTVNLLTDGLPAIALARDPAAADTMSPRSRSDALFGRELKIALAIAGVAVGAAATAAFVIGRELAPNSAQTMAYTTIALAELAFVYSVRSPRAAAWQNPRNRILDGGVLASAGLLALTIYVPPLRNAFGTVALGATELGIATTLAAAPALLVEGIKALRRRR
jgi:P-type Ca2+ transporter type 2C